MGVKDRPSTAVRARRADYVVLRCVARSGGLDIGELDRRIIRVHGRLEDSGVDRRFRGTVEAVVDRVNGGEKDG